HDFAPVQPSGASAERCRVCCAGSGGAMRADVDPPAAQRPCNAVRPGVGRRMSQKVTSMEVLARWVSRYAGWTVAAVVVLLVLCGLYSAQLNDRVSGGGWVAPGAPV